MNKILDYSCKTIKDLTLSKKHKVELIEREKIKKGEKISVVSDTMFKCMFMSEKRIKYSAKLLSYFLDYSYEYLLKNMTLVKNELSKEKEYSKGERCDFVAEIDDGFVNIEVNSNDSKTTMERNVDYAFRLYGSKNNIGDDYDFRSIVQFNINNFSFEENDEIIDVYSLRNENNITLTNKLIIIQIYVPNIYKKCYTKGIKSLTERERYLLAMAEQNISKAIEYAQGDEIMNDYVEESLNVITDNGFGESYDHEWAWKDQGRREGKEEGLQEGLEKGRQEGKLQIASALLKKNIDIRTIVECTGLTEDEIKNLDEQD